MVTVKITEDGKVVKLYINTGAARGPAGPPGPEGPPGPGVDPSDYVPATRTVNSKALSTDIVLDQSDIGLGNVDNTSDANKPISTATQAAIDAKADLVDGKVPANQLPGYVDDVLEYADLASFPVTGEAGKIYIALDANKTYRWSGSTYVEIGGGGVALGETASTAYRGDRGKIAYDHSQDTTTNPHGVTKSQVGLSNVDNTSDSSKPVSTAQQTALNLKADKSGFVNGETPSGSVNSSNTVFTMANNYISGSVQFFINGLRRFEFTESAANQITMTFAPTTGDIVRANYRK